MLRTLSGKVRKLWRHPGFQARPFTVLARGLGLLAHVLRGRQTLITLTPAGERLLLPVGARYTSVTLYLLRDHAEVELGWLDRLIGPGGHMLDIGANIGIYSLRGATLVGSSGRVIAIEPGQQAQTALRANLALNRMPQVTVLPVALAAEDGVGKLYHVALGDDPQAFSLMPQENSVPSEQVVTRTLDSVLHEAAFTRLDLIKMDVEGLELEVLRSGATALTRLKPIIIFEINATSVPTEPDGAQGAFMWLSAAGYRMHQLVAGRLVHVPRQPAGHGNLIAVHPEGAQPRPQGSAGSNGTV